MTGQEAAGRRADLTLAQWRETINASFAALEITAPVDSEFRADLTTVELDDVHLFDMTTSAHRVVRTAEMVARDAGEYLKLSLQLQAGRGCARTGGSACWAPADWACTRPTARTSWSTTAPSTAW